MRYRDKILYRFVGCFAKAGPFFKDLGCRAADHGLEYISQVEYSEQELDRILEIKLSGGQLSFEQVENSNQPLFTILG